MFVCLNGPVIAFFFSAVCVAYISFVLLYYNFGLSLLIGFFAYFANLTSLQLLTPFLHMLIWRSVSFLHSSRIRLF